MSLPRWMEPLLEAGETKELDRWAMQERGIPGEELMERAGEGLAAVVARRAPASR
jgi:NAD(P)H-hydrate repair Nnr-like enzyme with NAD(P)H-hydrate epimerase domain